MPKYDRIVVLRSHDCPRRIRRLKVAIEADTGEPVRGYEVINYAVELLEHKLGLRDTATFAVRRKQRKKGAR